MADYSIGEDNAYLFVIINKNKRSKRDHTSFDIIVSDFTEMTEILINKLE